MCDDGDGDERKYFFEIRERKQIAWRTSLAPSKLAKGMLSRSAILKLRLSDE
jgi:hypothetical protein